MSTLINTFNVLIFFILIRCYKNHLKVQENKILK